MCNNQPFDWHFLSAIGSAGGILVGCRNDLYTITVGDKLNYNISVMILDKKANYFWRLVVVYGSPYDEGKADFIDELHNVMGAWNGPTMIGGDFNLTRFASDKNNGVINQKWANCFNDWVNRWALIELKPSNRSFTWANNQKTGSCLG